MASFARSAVRYAVGKAPLMRVRGETILNRRRVCVLCVTVRLQRMPEVNEPGRLVDANPMPQALRHQNEKLKRIDETTP